MVSRPVTYRDIEQQALRQEQAAGRKKVVFVLPTLSAGGAERVLITLMNGLDRDRFQPEFVVLNEKGTLREWIASGIPYHSLGRLKVSRGLPRLLKTLNALQPDIIVSTMAAMNYGILLLKPFLKGNPRIVVREAVIPSSIAESQSLPWVVRKAYQNLYPQADMVISPAQCIIDEFRSYLGMQTDRHVLLHNPVDLHKIRAEQIIQPPADAERLKTARFVCAGRLHPQKGFDRLIAALPAIREHSWTLHIMGTGAEAAKLQALIDAHGLSDRVFLDGLVQRPWPVMGAADCFLLPSRWEGLPNVVLESLAAGTPVIGMSEAGGIQEIADLAPRGAVTVVDRIEDMVRLMPLVRPKPTTVFRASLLPEYFHLDKVVERFSAILEGGDPARILPADLQKQAGPLATRKFFGRRAAVSQAA